MSSDKASSLEKIKRKINESENPDNIKKSLIELINFENESKDSRPNSPFKANYKKIFKKHETESS